MKRWFVGSASVLTAVALVAERGVRRLEQSSSTTRPPSSGAKGGTLMTVANAAPSGSPDPQVNYTLQYWQLYQSRYDGLVAFKKAGGNEGFKIVPDLAEAMPDADQRRQDLDASSSARASSSRTARRSTGDGRRRLRSSASSRSQQPDRGHLLQRASSAPTRACKTPDDLHPRRRRGRDDAASTVTINLTAPDPEFLDKLAVPHACILPGGYADEGRRAPSRCPAPAPYMFTTYDPEQADEARAQPALQGVVAGRAARRLSRRDHYDFGLTDEAADRRQIQNGQADWMFDPPPADRLGEIGSEVPDAGAHQPADGDRGTCR